ncbi:MAG: hypothetical protein HUJ54_04070 [Erysipelotrichaceae bacterium]|nr:hypothetical protein [Erysipelotrichaceae bacterium]
MNQKMKETLAILITASSIMSATVVPILAAESDLDGEEVCLNASFERRKPNIADLFRCQDAVRMKDLESGHYYVAEWDQDTEEGLQPVRSVVKVINKYDLIHGGTYVRMRVDSTRSIVRTEDESSYRFFSAVSQQIGNFHCYTGKF